MLSKIRVSKSSYDPLTGLPSSTLLYDRLSQSILFAGRKGRSTALFFLALNELKLINDTLGKKTGDNLLIRAADRLKKCLRRSDTIARPGRNEFIILLPEIAHADDAMIVADKILSKFDAPFVIGKNRILVNINIGISLFPNDGLESDILLNKSYTAMNTSKEKGKNGYAFFSDSMNSKAFERLSLENNLRTAIKKKEFVLHYQPQINLDNSRIIGMEALIRWQRPGTGLVAPMEFIPIAEETGLIVPINEWVLYTACEQQRSWQKAGIAPDRMAVNVSATEFIKRDLVDIVAKALKETGLAPDNLELELTERLVFQNEGDTTSTLIRLKEMGIHISIDDFGTGYSSLVYISQFPIDKLKIVRSFVRSISINKVDSAIAKLIIDLSKVLNIKVIAEGVETKDQLEFLKMLGCDEVQGYFFSKPLDAKTATDLLLKTNLILKK